MNLTQFCANLIIRVNGDGVVIVIIINFSSLSYINHIYILFETIMLKSNYYEQQSFPLSIQHKLRIQNSNSRDYFNIALGGIISLKINY